MTKVQLNGVVSSENQNRAFDRPSFLHKKAEMIKKTSVLDQILYHLNKSNEFRDKEHVNYKEKILFICKYLHGIVE